MELSNEIALSKLQQYCVYQDRCHSEVRTKLLSLHVYGDDLEMIISELIQEKYLDEERYAKSFARGKFNIKKWGRNKIKLHLKQKQVSPYCIKKGLQEIDEAEYLSTLQRIYDKKLAACTDDNAYTCKQKAMKYCISRGYESNLVYALGE